MNKCGQHNLAWAVVSFLKYVEELTTKMNYCSYNDIHCVVIQPLSLHEIALFFCQSVFVFSS